MGDAAPPRARSPRRRSLFPLAALTLATLTASGLAEAAVRLFWPQADAPMWFESHPRYGHTLKKNFYQKYRYPRASIEFEVRTNSLGLRGHEYDLSRLDRKRVLLLGDSFTFGEGLNVEHIFATKLEALLSGRQEGYIVINTGVGGWGTLQEVAYAKDHLHLYRPDVIVLTFCGNDPAEDSAFVRRAIDNEKGRLYFPGKIFIRNNSHLYRFAYTTAQRMIHSRELSKKRQEHPGIPLDGQSSSLITEDEWRSTLGHIREFHEEFRRFNPAGLLLVQATYPMNVAIREHLETLTDGRSLFYVDLHDATIRLGPERVRLPSEGHWTPEMHSVSAEALFRAISRLGDHAASDSRRGGTPCCGDGKRPEG